MSALTLLVQLTTGVTNVETAILTIHQTHMLVPTVPSVFLLTRQTMGPMYPTVIIQIKVANKVILNTQLTFINVVEVPDPGKWITMVGRMAIQEAQFNHLARLAMEIGVRAIHQVRQIGGTNMMARRLRGELTYLKRRQGDKVVISTITLTAGTTVGSI